MKKVILSLVILIACSSVKAQLANKKWAGTLQLDQAVDVVLDFKKDSVDAITVADGQVLETMTFSIKGKILTLKKVYGQSECNDEAGKYKFEIVSDSVTLTLVEDACTKRSNVLDKTKWKRQK